MSEPTQPRAVCEHYCDRAWHKAQTARTPATVVLRCQGCGRVIARCTACEEGYPPGNAAATMRAHLRSSYCLSRAARGADERKRPAAPAATRSRPGASQPRRVLAG